jgi:hypothetical protein
LIRKHIAVLSLLLGLINAFDIPTRQAFTVEMLEEKEGLAKPFSALDNPIKPTLNSGFGLRPYRWPRSQFACDI